MASISLGDYTAKRDSIVAVGNAINDCGDEYMRIDVEQIEADFDNASTHVMTIAILSYSVIALIVIAIAVFALIIICK
jgi:hypothetical protein